MPRVLVTTDGPRRARQVVIDRRVDPAADPEHYVELLEVLDRSIEDAVRAEAALRDAIAPRSYRDVSAG